MVRKSRLKNNEVAQKILVGTNDNKQNVSIPAHVIAEQSNKM